MRMREAFKNVPKKKRQTRLRRLHQIIQHPDLKSDVLSNGEREHTGLLD